MGKSNNIVIFEHTDLGELQGFLNGDTPWFVAKDVCRSLGIQNTSRVVRKIEEDWERLGVNIGIRSTYTSIKTPAGTREALCIPEEIVYEIAFQSRKDSAIIFRAWIAGEVLPSIRKYGEYRTKSIACRREDTDEIKKVVALIQSVGGNTDWVYSNFTRLTNKISGITSNQRAHLSEEISGKVCLIETMQANLIKRAIKEGVEPGDIYRWVKSRLVNLVNDVYGE